MPRVPGICLLLGLSVGVWAQQQGSSSSNQSPANSSPAKAGAQDSSGTNSSAAKPAKTQAPNLTPPRSDRVDAGSLGDDIGESSSKDTQIDLSPPENDARSHPQSSEAVANADAESSGGSSVREFHIWDPHKAAKSVEVGDFYFKRKNYHAAEDRYREALQYKDNDAIATFRLAVCLEKLDRPDDARAEYESYLRILPHGPLAEEAQKSIDRLKTAASKSEAK
jgi:tetratricopeptide (TPR) repeat protein